MRWCVLYILYVSLELWGACAVLYNCVFQKADLAITDLTITSEREAAVDFTHPFMSLGEHFTAMCSSAHWNDNSHLCPQLPTNNPMNHLCNCQTNSMELSPNWEANSSSASQEIFCILWKPKVLSSQDPVSCSYHEPDEPIWHPPIWFLEHPVAAI